jgi:hypothetical protein
MNITDSELPLPTPQSLVPFRRPGKVAKVLWQSQSHPSDIQFSARSFAPELGTLLPASSLPHPASSINAQNPHPTFGHLWSDLEDFPARPECCILVIHGYGPAAA